MPARVREKKRPRHKRDTPPPRIATCIDASAFPHIIDLVVMYLCIDHPTSATSLQAVCSRWRKAIIPRIFDRIRVDPNLTPDGKYKGSYTVTTHSGYSIYGRTTTVLPPALRILYQHVRFVEMGLKIPPSVQSTFACNLPPLTRLCCARDSPWGPIVHDMGLEAIVINLSPNCTAVELVIDTSESVVVHANIASLDIFLSSVSSWNTSPTSPMKLATLTILYPESAPTEELSESLSNQWFGTWMGRITEVIFVQGRDSAGSEHLGWVSFKAEVQELAAGPTPRRLRYLTADEYCDSVGDARYRLHTFQDR